MIFCLIRRWLRWKIRRDYQRWNDIYGWIEDLKYGDGHLVVSKPVGFVESIEDNPDGLKITYNLTPEFTEQLPIGKTKLDEIRKIHARTKGRNQ